MSKFSVRKPLTVFMAVIAAIVLGVVSYTRMTPDLLPSIDLPYVVIITTYPGATPEKVEMVISKPIEQAMGTLNGIVNISSSSSENASMVMLEFEEETNMDTATVDILQSLNQIEGYWDDDMIGTPYLMKLNPNMMPVAVAGVQMEGMDRSELSAFLNETLLSQLESINGVASVTTVGDLNEEVSVLLSQEKIDALYDKIYAEIDKNFEEPQQQLDDSKAQLDAAIEAFDQAIAAIDLNEELPDEMKEAAKAEITSSEEYIQVIEGIAAIEEAQAELDAAKEAAHSAVDLSALLSMDTLSGILTAQSFSMPAGYVNQGNASWMVNIGDEITSIDEIQELVLVDLSSMGMEGIEPVRIKDVANVVITDDGEEIYAKLNGKDGIMLSFSKQSSYATADVADKINDKFEELSEEYEGLEFVTLMDQGEYIDLVVGSITSSLLWGALFAIIVLFIFLRDIRPTFITLCSIPVSVLFAIVLMYFSGITLNMMSLSGLAIAVGMLVDNSIVVIENVYRLKMQGESAAKAAISGAAQVAGAITASTLTTICVFLPIVFIDGLTRTLFVDMALTLGYALIASLIIAVTFVPAMSSKVLKKDRKNKKATEGKILANYKKAVTWCLSHKIVVFAVAIMLLVGSIAAELAKGFTFMPDMDMPQLSATLETEIGTSVEETTALADEAIARILQVEEVETIGTMMSSGLSLMGGGGSNSVTYYIMLDENKTRSSDEIIKEINELCADLDCEFEATGAMDVSSLMGGAGIAVYIYGDDLDVLRQTAQEVSDVIAGVEGVDEVTNGLEDNDPALKITVDKEKAMLNGLTVAQVFMEISGAVTTEQRSIDVIFDDTSYEVYISSEDTDALTPDDIRNYTISVTGIDGNVNEVKLSDIATIEDTEALSSISRTNQKRYLVVSAAIAEDYNVTLVAQDVEKALDDYSAPAGVELEISGESENIEESMIDLIQMLLLGVMLVYMIMVSQFQSLKSPFIVMFTIPLAFTGGMLGLLITGFEISVISMLGFVMLCGIIVNNGIVLVDYINQLRIGGMERRRAIVEAGATRMRPIFMTSITTILGLIVMALGVGNGSEMMQPIAIVCIGGLIYATVLTLFVIPCLYDLMNKKEIKTVSKEDMEISEL